MRDKRKIGPARRFIEAVSRAGPGNEVEIPVRRREGSGSGVKERVNREGMRVVTEQPERLMRGKINHNRWIEGVRKP